MVEKLSNASRIRLKPIPESDAIVVWKLFCFIILQKLFTTILHSQKIFLIKRSKSSKKINEVRVKSRHVEFRQTETIKKEGGGQRR